MLVCNLETEGKNGERLVWTLEGLFLEYLQLDFYFFTEGEWEEYPRNTQIDILMLQSALHAFTGESVDLRTASGRQYLNSLFNNGFNMDNEVIADEEAETIKRLLSSHGPANGNGGPLNRLNTYRDLLRAIKAEYDYIASFNGLIMPYWKSAAARIFYRYKQETLDRVISEKSKVFWKALKVLLPGLAEKSFAVSYLQKNYGYPDISHEEYLSYVHEFIDSMKEEKNLECSKLAPVPYTHMYISQPDEDA